MTNEKIEKIIKRIADDFHSDYDTRYSNVELKIDKFHEEFKTINDYVGYFEVYLDDYLDEFLERFIYMFYTQKKWIFSRIKNEILPEIKNLIGSNSLYIDTDKTAKQYLGKFIWPKIIEKNNLAKKALDLLEQHHYMKDGMPYKGQKDDLSKLDSVRKDLYKYSEEIEYNQFNFA